MRKSSLVVVLVVLIVLAAAVAAGMAGGRSAPLRAASAAKPLTHWCNFVLAGKNATADGSVLMGYNNDWSPNNYAYLRVVPGDATHYQFVELLTKGDCEEGGVNVHQLAAFYGTATDIDPAVLAADPYVKKGHGGEIWKDILQQCTTASQAINLLGQMATDGFGAGAAGSFAVGDPDHVWLFELLGGHHWVAEKRAEQRGPRPPQHGDHPPGGPRATPRTSVAPPTFSRSRRASAATARPTGPSTSPGPTATARSSSRTTTPTGCGAPSTPSPRRLGLTPTMPFATRPVYVVPDHRSPARRSRPSAATTTRARASTRPTGIP